MCIYGKAGANGKSGRCKQNQTALSGTVKERVMSQPDRIDAAMAGSACLVMGRQYAGSSTLTARMVSALIAIPHRQPSMNRLIPHLRAGV